MWKYSFCNFCFLILATILMSVHQPMLRFGSRTHWSLPVLSPPAEFGRAAGFFEERWHRGMVLKDWLMDYNTSQWEIYNASTPVETDLLEARFHVTNAEAFTEAMSEADRALKELDSAESSLEAAQVLVEPKLDSQLESVEKEITAAERSERSSELAAVPFDAIKRNLDHLIQSVRSSKNT